MNTEQLLAEIRNANLVYLNVAQKLIEMDKAEAMASLGVSAQSADLLSGLDAHQLDKLAGGSTLLCRFPINDDTVFGLLTSSKAPASRFSLGGLMAEAA
ncbi:flagellar transcriptional regulator FlhD [Xylophilus rhododendri]|uniref:Flagellar transcriptional regulator FlhD n=1 Tax=Xylophilus rhododendri TaxID=2697032 RepID=A0A857J3E7_9BURK|nr:flagellar transcriptional regulator FlhD [Xylophilus rhododendri]QHI97582.1 flagellar transcriptional regulator FlhD [Xylophilus rhododendri]